MNENEETPNQPGLEQPRTETLEELSRRRFFARLSIVLGGGTLIGLSAPMVGFILAPLTRRGPEVWRTLGKINSFEIGDTVAVSYEDASPLPWAGVTARTAAWLRRTGGNDFIAFSVHCTHLGCPLRWMREAHLFMCPCHGGVFYEDGSVAAGPPERPMTRLRVRALNGEVQIETAGLPILSQ